MFILATSKLEYLFNRFALVVAATIGTSSLFGMW